MSEASRPASVRNPLVALHELGRAARRAQSVQELEFIAVNDTRTLSPYRQAAFWRSSGGVQTLSGIVKMEANVPYVQWLNAVFKVLASRGVSAQAVRAGDLPDDLAKDWQNWLPANALWIALPEDSVDPARNNPAGPDSAGGHVSHGGFLFARDLPWNDSHISILTEWIEVWTFIWRAQQLSATGWRLFGKARLKAPKQPAAWWRSRSVMVGVAVLLVLCIPVRLTVLAPGELVPANPSVLRAPLDGVIDAFHVAPNEIVEKGQLLFALDESLIRSKMAVTQQSLATAEAEYRQVMQRALTDERAKTELRVLQGRIEEKRAELDYITAELARCRVLAPQKGIALFDDPSEWIGRPVQVGERVMRVAALDDVEVEGWVSVADAIPLEPSSRVRLFLDADPTDPVNAELRYMAHEAVQRPDSGYAYRLRAALDGETGHRVGMKGTVKLHGRWVPVAYWVFRRPLAALRTTVGW